MPSPGIHWYSSHVPAESGSFFFAYRCRRDTASFDIGVIISVLGKFHGIHMHSSGLHMHILGTQICDNSIDAAVNLVGQDRTAGNRYRLGLQVPT